MGPVLGSRFGPKSGVSHRRILLLTAEVLQAALRRTSMSMTVSLTHAFFSLSVPTRCLYSMYEDVIHGLESCSELIHLGRGQLNCEPVDLAGRPLRLLKCLPSSPEKQLASQPSPGLGTPPAGALPSKWLLSAIGKHHSQAERKISEQHRKHCAHHGAARC